MGVSRRTTVWICIAVCLLAVGSAGCTTTLRLREGRRAEQAGDYPRAYVFYCRVAQERPSSRSVAAAIARVSPGAARYWKDRAAAAIEAGDVERTWQCYMRALSIRPDDRDAADRIRSLERDHGDELAAIRHQYLTRDLVALASAGAPPRTRRHDASPPEPVLARANDATPQLPGPGNPPEPSAAPTPGKPGDSTPEPSPATGSDATPPSTHEYLFTGTVSRDDRRFPEKRPTIDGLVVKVRDTDPGPDADLDAYLGRNRIGRGKDLKVGQCFRVRGRSGRSYEIVILAIIDSTETVRFAIRRKNGTGPIMRPEAAN